MKARTLALRTSAFAALLGLFTPAIVFVESAPGQIPCRYQVEAIFQGPPGPVHDSPTFPLSISPNGQHIVGYFNYDAVGQARGWYYEMPDGPFTPLPHPPGLTTSTAEDVSDAGKVCGHIGGTAGDFGFVFDIGTQQYTLLPPAYPGSAWANSINAQGVVCGTRTVASGLTSSFIWSASSGFQDAGAIDGMNNGFKCISDTGYVAGWRGSSQSSSNTRGISGPITAPQVLPPIPGGTTSSSRAVNEVGAMCGFGRLPSPFGGTDDRAFMYQKGVMTLLGVLPGYRRSRANEIADGGLVVGSCDTLESNGAFAPRAFVWYDGVMRDVSAMLQVPVGQTITLNSISGLATSGRLAGYGYANGISDLVVVLAPLEALGDLNDDCVVGVNDLLMVINAWGTADANADADGDGLVNVIDLLLVINNWTV